MTQLQQTWPHKQRIPLTGERHSAAGLGMETQVSPTPLDAMTIMQTAIEGGREQIEETQALRPIPAEAAEHILLWAAEDSLDWDRLIGSIDGWGTPEP